MGKINYTLLNASVLNASRLNMTGETGKPGGGAGGYWPEGTPAAIRRSAVLWYDIAKQGATNETMAANPVLKDLSGHGHDATCYNFGWGGMSGIGGYAADFSGWENNSTQYIELEKSPTKIEVKIDKGSDWIIYTNKPLPQLSVRVSGMEEGDYLEFRYFSEEGTTSLSTFRMESNGIYTLPESFVPNLVNKNSGFVSGSVDSTGLVIEIIPQYPGALVSDGVDDYAMVEGLPIIQSLIINANVDALTQQEGKWSYLYDSMISEGRKNRFYATFNWLGSFESAPNLIDGYSERGGESSYEGQQDFCLFANYSLRKDFGAMVFFSLLLFSRKLTPEEIEWVKNNLIENNTEE